MKILLSMWLILACGLAASQEPPKQRSATATSQAKSNQRGTEKAPLFVRGEVTTKKDAAEAREDADERKEKREVDRALVKYTGLTALFAFLALLVATAQAGFFWRQLRLMRKGIDDAYEVAQSARTNSDLALKEFNESHFPRLLVRRVRIPDPETTNKQFGIEFVLANVGNAVARSITININITAVPRADGIRLQSQAIPLYGKETAAIDGELKPRERRVIFVVRESVIRPKWEDVGRGIALLFFYGYVTYHDASGFARDTGFFRDGRAAPVP